MSIKEMVMRYIRGDKFNDEYVALLEEYIKTNNKVTSIRNKNRRIVRNIKKVFPDVIDFSFDDTSIDINLKNISEKQEELNRSISDLEPIEKYLNSAQSDFLASLPATLNEEQEEMKREYEKSLEFTRKRLEELKEFLKEQSNLKEDLNSDEYEKLKIEYEKNKKEIEEKIQRRKELVLILKNSPKDLIIAENVVETNTILQSEEYILYSNEKLKDVVDKINKLYSELDINRLEQLSTEDFILEDILNYVKTNISNLNDLEAANKCLYRLQTLVDVYGKEKDNMDQNKELNELSNRITQLENKVFGWDIGRILNTISNNQKLNDKYPTMRQLYENISNHRYLNTEEQMKEYIQLLESYVELVNQLNSELEVYTDVKKNKTMEILRNRITQLESLVFSWDAEKILNTILNNPKLSEKYSNINQLYEKIYNPKKIEIEEQMREYVQTLEDYIELVDQLNLETSNNLYSSEKEVNFEDIYKYDSTKFTDVEIIKKGEEGKSTEYPIAVKYTTVDGEIHFSMVEDFNALKEEFAKWEENKKYHNMSGPKDGEFAMNIIEMSPDPEYIYNVLEETLKTVQLYFRYKENLIFTEVFYRGIENTEVTQNILEQRSKLELMKEHITRQMGYLHKLGPILYGMKRFANLSFKYDFKKSGSPIDFVSRIQNNNRILDEKIEDLKETALALDKNQISSSGSLKEENYKINELYRKIFGSKDLKLDTEEKRKEHIQNLTNYINLIKESNKKLGIPDNVEQKSELRVRDIKQESLINNLMCRFVQYKEPYESFSTEDMLNSIYGIKNMKDLKDEYYSKTMLVDENVK